jgi:DNA-binding NarL/FixJ family response regulator
MAAPDSRIAIVGGAGELITEALTLTLTKGGGRVVGAYPNLCVLKAALEDGEQRPHVALVDGDDPAIGPRAVAELKGCYPELKILLLCAVASPVAVRCAIGGHVEGVVLKSDALDEVILGLRNVLEGRAVMPAGWREASVEPETIARLLSLRELEVLDLAASGLSNREIAERLVISVNTVKFHLRGIYSSLGVNNRVQASRALSQSHG